MNHSMASQELFPLLSQALAARARLLADTQTNALRLFAGFYEGFPGLVVDLYDRTLVLFDHRDTLSAMDAWMDEIQQFYLDRLPQINCVVRKSRNSPDPDAKNGVLTFRDVPAEHITELGIQYAVDLTLNQDASFYLDTRNLRKWLKENSRGLSVLNTFAYTGSLGVAALAGGAAAVVQTDRNKSFLALARTSCMLNHLDLGKMKLRPVDFFVEISQLKAKGDLFDLVLLDPPFFSVTDNGTVDQQESSARLINKVRPLVKDGGRIVAINNSLFLSGEAYKQTLDELCVSGFLTIEAIIPVPDDVTGFPATVTGQAPVPPAPFNHPTKIVVLQDQAQIAKKL